MPCYNGANFAMLLVLGLGTRQSSWPMALLPVLPTGVMRLYCKLGFISAYAISVMKSFSLITLY